MAIVCNEMEKMKVDVIEEFMDFKAFQKILDENNNLAYNGIFKIAWDNTVDTIEDRLQDLLLAPRRRLRLP